MSGELGTALQHERIYDAIYNRIATGVPQDPRVLVLSDSAGKRVTELTDPRLGPDDIYLHPRLFMWVEGMDETSLFRHGGGDSRRETLDGRYLQDSLIDTLYTRTKLSGPIPKKRQVGTMPKPLAEDFYSVATMNGITTASRTLVTYDTNGQRVGRYSEEWRPSEHAHAALARFALIQAKQALAQLHL